jgi:hypothetical protein
MKMSERFLMLAGSFVFTSSLLHFFPSTSSLKPEELGWPFGLKYY